MMPKNLFTPIDIECAHFRWLMLEVESAADFDYLCELARRMYEEATVVHCDNCFNVLRVHPKAAEDQVMDYPEYVWCNCGAPVEGIHMIVDWTP